MFQAKCVSCDFPIEPGDQYLEAMGGTYHVECFNCSVRLHYFFLAIHLEYILFYGENRKLIFISKLPFEAKLVW
jgi:hypothetical protein